MHEYVQNHFMKIDVKPITGKFGSPKKRYNFIHPNINKNDEFYNSIPELNDYIRDYKDPSLGPRHLEKMYPYSRDV